MMKKYALWGLLSAGLLCASISQAEYYVGGGLGQSFNGGRSSDGTHSVKFENSSFWSLAVGGEAPLPLCDVRGEAEIVHTRPDVKDGRTKHLNGMFFNGYADVPLVPVVDPYVGAGIGFIRFDHQNSFALQGMLGLEYEFTSVPMAVSGEYRYMKINERTGKANKTSNYHANVIMLKARYLF